MHRLLRWVFASFTFVAAVFVFGGLGFAESVWSGFSYSFSKASFADVSLPENQDRITNNVWITRGNNQGIYNIHDEISYLASVSPAGTLWATELNNPGKTIAATNWSSLAFTDWVNAYGGAGSTLLPSRLLANNAVVHLVADNTYLDLRFTGWAGSGGGGFAYDRAIAPPPSTTGDYNLNGVVDAADYVVWRDTLSQMVSPQGSGADGNANGTIDSGDYAFWRAHFGNLVAGSVAGDSLGASAVPEPASAMLIIVGLLSFQAASRRER